MEKMKNLYESETPHFFQIIVANTLQLGQMEVPTKFVRKYGEIFSRSILLKVPTGDKWPVRVERSEKSIIFCHGWPEFMEHYSLDVGSFVVFRLEAQSVFSVVIFDISSTEIGYPLKHVPRVEEEESSDEDIEEFSSGEAAAGSFGSSSETTIEISDDDFKLSDAYDDGEEKEEEDFSFSTEARIIVRAKSKKSKRPQVQEQNLPISKRIKGKAGAGAGEASLQMATPLLCQRARKEADEFKSDHPFFRVQIMPSYIARGPRVYLYGDFLRRNNLTESVQTTSLEVLDRSWSVMLHYYQKVSYGYFRGGWFEFSRDNHLQEGDVCVFELARRNNSDIVFKVSIFRSPAYD